MQLENLQLDLRPRPHWQAIDLGYALLRKNALTCYAAWWALWGPFTLLMMGLLLVLPADWSGISLFIMWWLKPFFERVVVFVLSRAVFGETINWKEAVKNWPSQLSGGWFRMLTWWRPIFVGRALYHPVWQLEGARGNFAKERRKAVGRRGVAAAATWFGFVCAHFELVVYLGIVALIGFFISDSDTMNPFALLAMESKNTGNWYQLLPLGIYSLAAGLISPVYVAGCFTLYLNRRAELEAWDIEIAFRRLAERCRKLGHGLVSLLLIAGACLLFASPSQEVRAAEQCAPPEYIGKVINERGLPHNDQQAQLRRQLDKIYTQNELRSYECSSHWVFKKQPKEKDTAKEKEDTDRDESAFFRWLGKLLNSSAGIFRILLITLAIGFVAWLCYRFGPLLVGTALSRDKKAPELPDEIAGLDIRPETLPEDVSLAVWQSWQAGQQRAALALLYRATISRLAHRYQIALPKGATEGDCLHAALQAQRKQQLTSSRFEVTDQVTRLWQSAAYADRWPLDAEVQQLCKNWKEKLDQTEQAA